MTKEPDQRASKNVSIDVDNLFSEPFVALLAQTVKLPTTYDRRRFGESVRFAVRQYIDDRDKPSANALARSARKLASLANRRQFAELADAVDLLSNEQRLMLQERQQRTLLRMPGWRIPTREELLDAATQAAAAHGISALIELGADVKPGKKRRTGVRSRSVVPILNAPKPSRSESRRQAEHTFAMWLQVSVQEQLPTDQGVAQTAHHNTPGPLARMIGQCLVKLGTYRAQEHAERSAAQFINDLRKERASLQVEVVGDINIIS